MPARLLVGVLPLTLLLAGCTAGTSETKKGGGAHAEVRQAFADFQAAIKKRDGDKLWDLLAEDSRQDADRKAKAIRNDFTRADDKEKADLEKKLDLSAAELRDLSGKVYLKSKAFYGKYHEVPDSTVEKVSVGGEKARLTYKEEDGDIIVQPLVREQGRWKLVAEMPK